MRNGQIHPEEALALPVARYLGDALRYCLGSHIGEWVVRKQCDGFSAIGRHMCFFIKCVPFYLCAFPAWSGGCDINISIYPKIFVDVVNNIQSGEYEKFVDVIDPSKRLPTGTRNELSVGLETYSSTGFKFCSLLKSDAKEKFLTAFLVFQSDDAVLYSFFAMAKVDGNWIFLKTQVSSDFDEVYALVR